MHFTTARRKSIGFNFQVCSVRFPIVSRCQLEANDATAQLRLPEKGTLDLDLIGGTLWLELWNTLVCPVAYGNSSGIRGKWMVITGSRTGTGETGRLRLDPNPLAVDEVEAEQEAVQIRVHKGPTQPTVEQVMTHHATHLPFRDWCVPKGQTGCTRESPSLPQRSRCVNWTISF